MDFEEPLLQSSAALQRGPDVTEEMESLRQLACRHVFHQLCIDSYLDSIESRQYMCPMCYKSVITLPSYLEQWRADFHQLVMSQRPSHDIEGDLDGAQEMEFTDGPRRRSLWFDKDGLLMASKYTFEPNNKYLGCRMSSNRSFLDEAKLLLKRNGILSEVALLIEAAIQEGDLGEGGYEAWILLGKTRYSDLWTEKGVHALTKGVRRALAVGVPVGMVFLAASYFSLYANKALRVVLLRWLQMRLPSMLVPEWIHKAALKLSFREMDSRITDLFLHVARAQFDGNIVEPDMQIALGILFYINDETLNAAACYAGALTAQPTDYHFCYMLLGLCLRVSQGKTTVWEETLRLCPTYTQAIFRLAKTYSEKRAYKEAAEYYLTALVLQECGAGKASAWLWSHLHKIFLAMNREDLAAISTVEAQTSLDVYRREGFQFMDVTALSFGVTT